MKLKIKHEIRNRIRLEIKNKKRLNNQEAESIIYWLKSKNGVVSVKVYDRTASFAIVYDGLEETRKNIFEVLEDFEFGREDILALIPDNSSRELMNSYKEKLITKIITHYSIKFFLPPPLKAIKTTFDAIRFIKEGLKLVVRRRLEVPVLDATAIGVSLVRRDFSTASSIMFLLQVGELLEEWTHKKSVMELAQSMALNVDKVWKKTDKGDKLVPIDEIVENDIIVVNVGNMIGLDGVVVAGEAMINQASLTGEPLAVKKERDSYVYAGTVVEEGFVEICVKNPAGSTRYEKIISMIEDSEKLKSSLESKAEHLADKLVPLTFLGTLGVYALTRNITKALTVLLVDFSCALKLSMPIAVLSAMRECQEYKVTVKGGKFLEAVSEADVVVFDKTGTFTKAEPKVADIIPFGDSDKDEVLKIAACLEEHFPHSVANAVVNYAIERDVHHDELHSEVEYVVAHGIASQIGGKKAIIGSHHFVFEDEKTKVPLGEEYKLDELPEEYSCLYLAIDGELMAVICIEDPLREESVDIVGALKSTGISKVVMMTGDSYKTATAIAKKVGVDEFFAEVLPEDKARFIEEQKALGKKVIMIGDGINDSPALSAADAGIAICDGSQLAREVADITISGDNLFELIILRNISKGLVSRINCNYRFVMGFNVGLIVLGLAGILQAGTSALLHNVSTLGISLHSMTDILDEDEILYVKKEN